MRRLTMTILLLCGLTPAVAARHIDDARLDESKPTVYLTLERLGDDGNVWLRLHNNTRWAISFRTRDAYGGVSDVTPLSLGDGRQLKGLVNGLVVLPEYFIEHAPEAPGIGGRYWCYSSASWLPSGRAVLFSFPRKELREWERLYLTYTYEWEHDENEPEHKVKFYGSDLRKLDQSSRTTQDSNGREARETPLRE
jgi:hypothetical protein